MSMVANLKCDQCGKLAPVPEGQNPAIRYLPDHWRTVSHPFGRVDEYNWKDVCSPGCAKLVLNQAVDMEWTESADGAVDSLVPSIGTPKGSERLYPAGTGS